MCIFKFVLFLVLLVCSFGCELKGKEGPEKKSQAYSDLDYAVADAALSGVNIAYASVEQEALWDNQEVLYLYARTNAISIANRKIVEDLARYIIGKSAVLSHKIPLNKLSLFWSVVKSRAIELLCEFHNKMQWEQQKPGTEYIVELVSLNVDMAIYFG